jgi:hypothetical protein
MIADEISDSNLNNNAAAQLESSIASKSQARSNSSHTARDRVSARLTLEVCRQGITNLEN